MNLKVIAISALFLLGCSGLAPTLSFAAVSPDEQSDLLRQKKQEDAKILAALKKKKVIEAKLKIAEEAKRKQALAKKRKIAPAQKTVRAVQNTKRECGSFAECLFGKRLTGRRVERSQFGLFRSASLSTRTSRKTVEWDETRYPVGSLIVRTPERALYYVSAEGEAIRYRVGVGREGFQWSGSSRIVAKQEWPSWTPPAEMIRREAEKGHEIPPFMEGGPGNPLGARALYIGGTIFRVHGTNNEASIGGAVSSGCIRMMNADVVDLYNRVKVGSRIYVYQ
jgi:lipoprotein-anchoring transpeptidase ErfK/SrfK